MKKENRKVRAYDVIGSIALVRFPSDFSLKEKKHFAGSLLKENNSIGTVLEKVGKFKGRLRKIETQYLAGEKTREVLYKENGCVFRFNVDTTYFSPRLSNERKEVASMIKKNDEVLVMFAGVAPFSIVIAKHSLAKKVVSVEINREASKYALQNVERNKLKGRVEVVQGDIKKFVGKLDTQKFESLPKKYDVIVMARPQLKDTFLKEAFALSKKGTKIIYYDFCNVDEVDVIVEKIKVEARKAKKKIKILKKKNAGELAPYKIRLRVDFVVF